jgi:hypothetical protein
MKVGRNDPCPCGSGKKFKKCCANKTLGSRKFSVVSDTASKMPGMGLFSSPETTEKEDVMAKMRASVAGGKQEETEKA